LDRWGRDLILAAMGALLVGVRMPDIKKAYGEILRIVEEVIQRWGMFC
jgi:hypothetical protein